MGQSTGRLAGKRVLVTGASIGIGAATARLLVSLGARVALLARRPEPLAALQAELGAATIAVAADVSDPAAVRTAVDRAEEFLGGFDVVVNNAGICHPLALEDLDATAWNETIAVNLSGSYYVARETGLRMRAAGGGSIVNLGSELSVVGFPLYVAYCASKAGVIGLTKALAVELAPSVRVNAVCPGPVDTPMLDAEFVTWGDPVKARADTNARVPLGRIATAEEIAEAIVYLGCDATYASGTTLEIDGGATSV